MGVVRENHILFFQFFYQKWSEFKVIILRCYEKHNIRIVFSSNTYGLMERLLTTLLFTMRLHTKGAVLLVCFQCVDTLVLSPKACPCVVM